MHTVFFFFLASPFYAFIYQLSNKCSHFIPKSRQHTTNISSLGLNDSFEHWTCAVAFISCWGFIHFERCNQMILKSIVWLNVQFVASSIERVFFLIRWKIECSQFIDMNIYKIYGWPLENVCDTWTKWQMVHQIRTIIDRMDANNC